MKQRSGFISNSSSCSFVLLGTMVTEQIWNKIKSKIPDDLIEKAAEEEGVSIDDPDLTYERLLYQWHNIYPDCPFTVIDDDDDYYIGYGKEFDEENRGVYDFDMSDTLKTLDFLELEQDEAKLYYGSIRR